VYEAAVQTFQLRSILKKQLQALRIVHRFINTFNAHSSANQFLSTEYSWSAHRN